MAFVVDASVATGWFLPVGRQEDSVALVRRLAVEDAVAPTIFPHEVRNAIVMAHFRGRLPEADVFVSLEQLGRMPIRVFDPAQSAMIAALALRRRLTAHDSAYIALAMTEGIPLATLDRKMRAAATAEGVPLLPELTAP